MLATASLGAIWSSCSPDFGVRGVLDRFGQIEPKVLFAADGYGYDGKRIRLAGAGGRDPARDRARSSSVVVVAVVGRRQPDARGDPRRPALGRRARGLRPRASSSSRASPFDHPLYILYSSGTTGAPKCIVHGAGGDAAPAPARSTGCTSI